MRLELFDVSRRWLRQRTQSNDGISFPEQGNCFTVFRSIRRPYITFKLPRRDMDMPPRPCNFFWYLAIGMCHFRCLWNGMCDRQRVEITVMQFTGHSLPVHHFVRHRGAFTLSHIVSQAHLCDLFRLLAIGMCHFHHLWNGMCDRQWVEITVMQFTGHSLPVHHFVTAQWDFFTLSHIVSQAVFYNIIHLWFYYDIIEENHTCIFKW